MRPTLKRKKIINPKKPRVLLPLQRLIVAKEILTGKPQKQIAADWKVSRSEVARIFAEHLEYKIVWKVPLQVAYTRMMDSEQEIEAYPTQR